MTYAGGDGVALARSIARTSRPAGSNAEAQARAACVSLLESRGFDVAEHPFEYSTLPGRFATPYAGGYVALFSFAGAAAAVAQWWAVGQTLAAVAFLSLVALAVSWAGARWGTRRARSGRRPGVNLVARRGVPNIWLVAHLDTKGQPVSLVVRAAGVVVIAVGWLVTLAGWIVFALGSAAGRAGVVGGLILAGLGAMPLAACFVTDRGTGALDNASGVATIFETVERLSPDVPIGVLVTTAEELALAGARAWAADRPPAIAINCDGVDDEGEIACILSRDPGGRLRRAIERSTGVTGVRARVRRSSPGVLFDSVALAEAGWQTMTVARGTLRSLARVHTAGDTLAAWSGSGVAETAGFVASVVSSIVDGDDGDHPAAREEQQWSRT
jgi:hypothetical protein